MNVPVKAEINGWLKIVVGVAIPLIPYTVAAIWWAAGIQAEQMRIAKEVELNRIDRLAMIASQNVKLAENARSDGQRDQAYIEIQRQISGIITTLSRIEGRIDTMNRRGPL